MGGIHITGASGSGTTTLGREVADRLDVAHLDADDFYWAPLEPKFSVKRPPDERVRLIESAIAAAKGCRWVLSGSISGWGESLVRRFALVVFLSTPTDVRLARLRDREAAMFGADALGPGGARQKEYEAFIAWASAYEDESVPGRNRARHEAWLAHLICPVLRLDGTEPVDNLVEAVSRAVG